MRPDPDELETIPLTRTLRLTQRRRGHRVATDDVLCAWAAVRARPTARTYLDLGAGHGAVTLMVLGQLPADARAWAIEAQAISYALLVDNLAQAELSDRVTPLLGDLRDPDGLAEGLRVELISGSPPFMPLGSGVLPRDPQRAGGRFELRGGVEAYAAAIARWLAPTGEAALLMDGASEGRCVAAFAAAGLARRACTVVVPRPGKAPRYRIHHLTLGGEGPREPEVTEHLLLADAAGDRTAAHRALRERLALPDAG